MTLLVLLGVGNINFIFAFSSVLNMALILQQIFSYLFIASLIPKYLYVV